MTPRRYGLPAHRFLQRAKGSQSVGNFAFDIDGVIDSFPREMGTMIAALTAAAHHVFIITGVTGDTVAQADIDAKAQFLNSLGLGADTYFQLICVPEPHDENKAKAIKDNDIGVLVDNSKSNVKAAAGDCVALLVWNSKEK